MPSGSGDTGVGIAMRDGTCGSRAGGSPGVRPTAGLMAGGIADQEGGTGTREAGGTTATEDGAGNSIGRESTMIIPGRDGRTAIIPGRGEASDTAEAETEREKPEAKEKDEHRGTKDTEGHGAPRLAKNARSGFPKSQDMDGKSKSNS